MCVFHHVEDILVVEINAMLITQSLYSIFCQKNSQFLNATYTGIFSVRHAKEIPSVTMISNSNSPVIFLGWLKMFLLQDELREVLTLGDIYSVCLRLSQ